MKQGRTTITHPDGGFAPRVDVGNDDRAVWVSFGTLIFYLSNQGDVATVIVRAEAYDQHGRNIPVESRGATDIRNQVEFSIRMEDLASPE